MGTVVRIILLVVMLCSCTSTKYVPVPSTNTEYKVKEDVKRDSVYFRDSIYSLVKGDTVFKNKYTYVYKYNTNVKKDTIIVRDSISIQYPVERSENVIQRAKKNIGNIAIYGIIIFLGYSFFRKK